MTGRRPQVTLTYAQSADGRIATRTGDSRWISGDATLELAHQLRHENDGIMVGIGTVLRDNPQLTCRMPGGRNPHRFVLDSSLRTPLESNIATGARTVATTVFHTEGPLQRVRALEQLGVDVRRIEGKRLTEALPLVLEQLTELGIDSLMVEGGSALLTSFFRHRFVDRLIVVSAPMIIGNGTQAVGELDVTALSQAWRGRTRSVRQAGEDIVWEIDFDS
jgi:riboflavin-specific deaminase-like protein